MLITRLMKCLSVLALSAAISPAFAEHPCTQDMRTLCKDVPPLKAARCLRENEAKLSDACRASLQQGKDKAESLRQACKQDIQTLCPKEAGKPRQVKQCLSKEHEKLSMECKTALQSLALERAAPAAPAAAPAQ